MHLARSSTKESSESSLFSSMTSLISSQLFPCNLHSISLISTFRSRTSCSLLTRRISSSDHLRPSPTAISWRNNPTFPTYPSITGLSSTSRSTTSLSRSSRTTTRLSNKNSKVIFPFIQLKTMRLCRYSCSTSRGFRSASSVLPTAASCSQYFPFYSGHRDFFVGRVEGKVDKVRVESDQISQHHHLFLHRFRDHAGLQEHPRKDPKLASEQDVRAHQR